MNFAEMDLASYYHNKKSHLSIYPVIVTQFPCNGVAREVPYRINLKSARTDGKGWKWIQIFTGEDVGRPLKNWDDVVFFSELELKRQSSIIEPLIYDDIPTAWDNWAKINGRINYVDLKLEKQEEQTGKFRMMNISDPDKDPRMKLAHWLPIWGAWTYFLDVFKKDLKEGKYVKM